jgi:hypothetical protein
VNRRGCVCSSGWEEPYRRVDTTCCLEKQATCNNFRMEYRFLTYSLNNSYTTTTTTTTSTTTTTTTTNNNNNNNLLVNNSQFV